MSNQNHAAKDAAGKAAAELIQEGMVVGLGSGSTAARFIAHLIERCREGLQIVAVASSKVSFALGKEGGIPMRDPEEFTTLDITVDGADEIDKEKRMIKGGGGALLQEKILAQMSREMVVIVDESKVVEHLGAFPLAVEIVPFARRATLYALEQQGYRGKVREGFVTDGGHYIVDLIFDERPLSPEEDLAALRELAGVVEVGLFLKEAGRVIVGYPDGSTREFT